MYERGVRNTAGAITRRQEGRRPDGKRRHHRVRHRAVASRLPDVQLAETRARNRTTGGRAGSGTASHDLSAVVLADGVGVAWIWQLAVRPSEAAGRTRVR